MRALIYTRVSIDTHGQGRSTTEQEIECRAWANRESWTITRVITETGSASAYARRARTQWPHLTAAIASGDHDILLTWEASRATRQLSEYAELADLCATHSVLWGYSGTIHDLTRRDARFRTGLDALLSADESARTSERVQRAVRSRATTGAPHGKLPYGYRREYDPTTGALLHQLPDETTAPIVREIYTRTLAGDGCNTIAKDLTHRNITPPRPPTSRTWPPQQWLPVTVKRIATNPTYAGLRTYRGDIIGPAAWPAIIDRDTWDKSAAIIKDPTRNTRTGDSTATHLLTGIATCGVCGAPVRRTKNRGAHSYSCMRTGCMRVTRVIKGTDEWVTDILIALLEQHADALTTSTTTNTTPEIDQAREQLQALQDRLDGFIASAADGHVSPTALATIEARLLPQVKEAERRLRTLLTPRALDAIDLTDPRAAWDAMDLPARRATIRALVDVTIYPRESNLKPRVYETHTVHVTPRW